MGDVVGAVQAPESARRAVTDLYQAHRRRLVGLARFLVGDAGAAEEIVQEAFVSLFRRWSALRDPSAAVAYLDRAVVLGSRAWVRRRVTARRHVPDRVRPTASAEDVGIDHRRHEALAEAVRALPRRQREVVVLRYYLDLSEEQIALTLGIGRGSVKRHAHRAMAALADRMEAWA